MKLKKAIATATSLALLALPTNTNAATQGTLGSTSTGIANISVTKSQQAQISDLSDMTLSNWSVGQGAVTLYSNVCIYSSTGSYKVTATGSGLLGTFTISSGLLNILSYSVTWNDGGINNLASTGTALTYNTQSSTFNNADTSSATCSGGGGNNTARVIVGITSNNMQAAASSSTPYTGTLTLVVAPI